MNSLRSRLVLLVLLATIPSASLTIYGGWKDRHDTLEAAEKNLQRLTNLAAASEAKSIEGARQLLITLAEVKDLPKNSKKCSKFLEAILKKNEVYVNLGVIQLNGDVTCSAVPALAPVNLADRPHFKKAIGSRKFIVGNYVFGRVIRKHTINLTYPILNSLGEVEAVIFAALDLIALDKFIDDIDLPAGAVLITSDATGTIISRRPNPEQWIGSPISQPLLDIMRRTGGGTSEFTDTDGITRLHASASIGNMSPSDFVVTIGIPREEIVATANRDQITALITLAITMLTALLAAWFVGDVTVLRRVKALVRTAEKIAAGNLNARTGIHYGREEISYLARAFDEMAQSLQEHEAERATAEASLFAEKERAQVTLKSIGDAVITTDNLGNVEYMNPVAETLTGWTAREAVGLSSALVFNIVTDTTRAPVADPVKKALEDGYVVAIAKDALLISRNGLEYAVQDSAAPIRNRKGEIVGAVLVFRDVSEARTLTVQLSYQASHDSLTGLCNRREFERRLQLLVENVASQEKHHALLYMDLDRFKIVNDTCGHSAGDELLRQITARLKPILRDSDTLARLGGDEFGALLENCQGDSAALIADKLRETVADYQFVWEDKEFSIGVSIGLVNFSDNLLSMPDILLAADSACYAAKGNGRNRVHTHHIEDIQHTGVQS